MNKEQYEKEKKQTIKDKLHYLGEIHSSVDNMLADCLEEAFSGSVIDYEIYCNGEITVEISCGAVRLLPKIARLLELSGFRRVTFIVTYQKSNDDTADTEKETKPRW